MENPLRTICLGSYVQSAIINNPTGWLVLSIPPHMPSQLLGTSLRLSKEVPTSCIIIILCLFLIPKLQSHRWPCLLGTSPLIFYKFGNIRLGTLTNFVTQPLLICLQSVWPNVKTKKVQIAPKVALKVAFVSFYLKRGCF